jgi:tRNA (Thr-GGU) A37 N-methylase
MTTPRQGRLDGPLCHIEIFPPWIPALDGLASYAQIEVLYWLHLSRRDLILQSPANDGSARGTFSLRSPVRPNPIGTSIARLISIEGPVIFGAWPRLHRRNPAYRYQAGTQSVHAHCTAAAG